VLSASLYVTVPVDGRVHGVSAGTIVRVQYRRVQGTRWRHFPIPARTDASGRFTAYVDPGPGSFELRVRVPSIEATSAIIPLNIG
jgi:hypothetical protein